MEKAACTILAATVLVAGCASSGQRASLVPERTPFHNPFATIERFENDMENGIYPGAGPDTRWGIRLRREERRAFRERARAVNSTIVLLEAFENGDPIPGRFDSPPRNEGGGSAPVEPSPAAPPISAPASASSRSDAEVR